ncbi:MAG: peptide ABC transporter substrate-binding protein, partial [Hyphomonadaceae bacterium]
MRRRDLLRGGAMAGAAAGLGACAGARTVGFDPARRSLDIVNGAEPLTLDPQKASGTWENNIIGNMFVGLVTEDAKAGIAPGMATNWEMRPDGMVWTFHLRQAYWSDGEACNAHDFVFAFQRILDPANLAEYAALLYPIKNAEAINKGETAPREVGVYALDDRTLEIHLEHPTPYLPEMLKHQTCFPVPKHRVLEHGAAWIKPENIVVNGPFILEKWWSNYIIHLRRNPAFFDSRNVWLNDLYFYPTGDPVTASRAVVTGERGWSTNFPSNRIAELRRAVPGGVRVAPFLLVSYLSFNMTRAPFDD